MPLITVQYAALRPKSELADSVAKAVNKLSADILHKNPTVTAVVVEEIDPARWFIGNKSLEQHGLAGFWLQIRIVEGTNTREDKAAFVAATFAKMNELIGPLHNESYVYVNEVRGDGYGYGGVTQNERHIANKLKQAGQAAA
jgi:4-oxalocrotonate tautomerase